MTYHRVPNGFFGNRNFPYFNLGIRKGKIRARFKIESIAGGGMPKITIGITGLLEISGRDCGIEERYRRPSYQVKRVTKGHALLYPCSIQD